MNLLLKTKPETHEKGWGHEEWICNSEKCCGKLLFLNAGAKFSFHFHLKKHEWFYILKGTLELKYKDLNNGTNEYTDLDAGDVVEIPIGFPHQLFALSDSIIIEISTQHFDSDSHRIEAGDSQSTKTHEN